jgi:gluconate kinase
MPLSLLDSQLRDLEPLAADEAGVRLDISKLPTEIIDDILQVQGQ